MKQDLAACGGNLDATAKINYEAGSMPPLDNLPGVDMPIKPTVMPEMSSAPMDIPPGAVQPPGPLYSRTMSADWS